MSSTSFREVIKKYTPPEGGEKARTAEIEYMRQLALTVLSLNHDVADLPFDRDQVPVVSQPLIEHMMKAPALDGSAEKIARAVREKIMEAHQRTVSST